MDCWILGCGPSLRQVEIPQNVLTIGTNDSYRAHWSPIYATSDVNALRRDYPTNEARALIYYTAINPKRALPEIEVLPGRPLEPIYKPERPSLRKSGVFASWLAIHGFGATRLHLVGFDMEAAAGHFDGAEDRHGIYEHGYNTQRKRLKAVCEGVESWIWLVNRFVPVASLPSTVMEVGPGVLTDLTVQELSRELVPEGPFTLTKEGIKSGKEEGLA